MVPAKHKNVGKYEISKTKRYKELKLFYKKLFYKLYNSHIYTRQQDNFISKFRTNNFPVLDRVILI